MGATNDHLSEETMVAVYRSLFRYWRKKGYSIADAEDLAQEGATKAIEKAKLWKKQAKLTTFLIQVGKFQGIDYLRSEGRQTRLKYAMKRENSPSQRRTPKADNQ
jgi:DNA-directed RNA polymerase specialized sigma24 family protein